MTLEWCNIKHTLNESVFFNKKYKLHDLVIKIDLKTLKTSQKTKKYLTIFLGGGGIVNLSIYYNGKKENTNDFV